MEMKTFLKEVKGRTFKTDFDFDDKHIGLVRDVLKCLKGKTVNVPDPSKKWTPPWKIPKSKDPFKLLYTRLRYWTIPKDYKWDNLSLAKKGLIQIPILEWLPVVCRGVSFDDAYGRYFGNINPIFHAFQVIRPLRDIIPVISGGTLSEDEAISELATKFTGDHFGVIIIARELKQSDDAFRFALAHEIQHATNKLEVVYPALTNWKGFIFNILEIDESLLDDFTESKIMDDILDKSTTKDELELLENTFGQSILTWYKAYEKITDK